MSRSRCRGSAAAGAGVLFAIAWSFGLWLIVLVLGSASTVLVRQRLLARRRLPARLAAWAAHAPFGPSTPVALEHALAVDLAAVSRGQLGALERAQVVLAESEDDPWRRVLGEERLARAHRLVTGSALVGIEPRREPATARLHIAAAVAALIAILAMGTLSQSRWWLGPMAVVHALLAVECVALYERRRALPELLASRSVRDPVQGLFVMCEEDVARSLVALANNDRVVIQQARCLLERNDQHPHARHRLAEAERLLVDGGGSLPGATLGAWLVAVAAPVIGFAVTLGVAFAVARLGVGEPTTFRRLTVQNPTPYMVNVEVTGAKRNGWLDVGSFGREGRRTVEELADQGRQWVFRFSYGGVDAGDLTLTGDQLARDGWRITAPAEVAERLRRAGLSESARSEARA